MCTTGNDHGYGESLATVRIYADGVLVFETETELALREMWEVATTHSPSIEITAVVAEGGES